MDVQRPEQVTESTADETIKWLKKRHDEVLAEGVVLLRLMLSLSAEITALRGGHLEQANKIRDGRKANED